MKEAFVHLHVHSHYSMMWGVSSPQALCRAAAAAGCDSLAVTDTNGFYGLIDFLDAARHYHLRPIVGTVLESRDGTAVLLAKTARGYELLSELVSRRHLQKDFSLLRDFPAGPDHLALLSSDPELLKALRSRAECWVEVIPGPDDRKTLQIARTLHLPPLATNAVHFSAPEEHTLHRLARAIDLNRTLSTLPAAAVVAPARWLQPAAAMARHFPHCPEALANTVHLARQCHSAWDHFHTVFPNYADRRTDHFTLLLDQCRQGIRRRYGANTPTIEKRLEEELQLIRAKGYVDYFLVVADIVRRRTIHCGRGSAAASLVSYLLGITHVDPLRHNLLFGRFLNPHRQDHPDIDVDFPWDERDGLWEELQAHYGPQRVAAVSNHVGFGARAAVREVARVYGLPAADIKEVTKRLGFGGHPQRIQQRVAGHPKFRGFPLDSPWPEILQLASRLETLPRHLSVHCGGIVLVPDQVSRYVPVQRSAKGVRIIQWQKEQAERAGLVKIDLLGNRSLAVIRDALSAIAQNTGHAIDYATFNPLDDPATLELLQRGDTLGVFYVESPAMRQLQQKTQRGDFEHLVLHSSIIRPAANRYIQEYIRRLYGAPYEPLHPRLEPLLNETYGILVYQEDVVRVAMALAGFTWAEADGLRKVLSKKSREQLASYRQRFFAGCAQRSITRHVVEAVWEMFISFAGYSFCKPHSASYALVSFKSAYLKAHYPAEFMAAVVSNGGGYYSTYAYLSAARRMGITLLGPDINASDWSYRGKAQTLRIGFQQLQNIHRESLQAILRERRRNGPFLSIADFLRRIRLNPADAAILVKSGSLDALADGLNRPQLLWLVQATWQNQAAGRRNTSPAQLSAFASTIRTSSVPALPDFSAPQRWRQEMAALGFVWSVHPLACYAPFLRTLRRQPLPAAQLERHVGRQVRVLGWPITRKEVLTQEGNPMEFVSFEDQTALYEAVFFPQAFQRLCQELDLHRAYLLSGRVASEFGAITLKVQQLFRIPERYSLPAARQEGLDALSAAIDKRAQDTYCEFKKVH